MSDERIEAVARAFVQETPVTHPLIGEIGPSAPAAIRYEQTRNDLLAVLDRLRDARSEDEGLYPCRECEHGLGRHQAQEGGCLDCECIGWVPSPRKRGER